MLLHGGGTYIAVIPCAGGEVDHCSLGVFVLTDVGRIGGKIALTVPYQDTPIVKGNRMRHAKEYGIALTLIIAYVTM